MNLGEAKLRAIKLINEYSNNANKIPVNKNADYLLRMNELANDAQMEIATIGKKIPAFHVEQIKNNNQPYIEIELPEDLYRTKNYIIKKGDELISKVIDCKLIGAKTLAIQPFDGEIIINYYRYPTIIDENTGDYFEFEIDIEAQQLIPYYIAGHIKLDEEPNISIQLQNEYEIKLSRLQGQNIDSIRDKEEIQNIICW